MADGKTSPVVGQGTVCLPNMILKSVLFVLTLTLNLLFVNNLMHDMNCVKTFFSSLWISGPFFREMIGIVEKKDGMYYLSRVENSSNIKSRNKGRCQLFPIMIFWYGINVWNIPISLICKFCILIFSSIKRKFCSSVSIVFLQNNPEVINWPIHINPQDLLT